MSQWQTRANEAVFNFRNFKSVVQLGLFDNNYRLIWANLGASGNTHDSTYFQNTSLWDGITSRKTWPGQVVKINGAENPPIILGDDASFCSLGQ